MTDVLDPLPPATTTVVEAIVTCFEQSMTPLLSLTTIGSSHLMGILLDTNVLSEILRSKPSPAVLAWFAGQGARTLVVSAVTQAAIALRNDAALATRNLRDFEGCGLRLIDPWT